MYWPTAACRVLSVPAPLSNDPILRLKTNRKGNFFAVLTKDGVGVWDVRPTVMQAAVVRTTQSIERWGENEDIFWAADGRGLIVLTSTSHLLVYTLTALPTVSYGTPTLSPGPGEAYPLTGWTLTPRGTAFVMGGCTTVCPQAHSLIIGLRHPSSILTVPWPIPPALLAQPGSHFPPLPLDGDGEEQAECDAWDLGKASWMASGSISSAPQELSVNRTPGLPTVWTMLMEDGTVWGMYSPAQVYNVRPLYGSQPKTPSKSTPAALPPHQASPSYFPPTPAKSGKFVGQAIYPTPLPHDKVRVDGVEALGLVADEGAESRTIDLPEQDKALEVAVNGRFGLIAIGTARGVVEMISLPTFPQLPRPSHTLDLKLSANLRSSPGSISSLAWTSDGYGLAVGYERGWAVWSMGGRLGGWGLTQEDESSDEAREGFMAGVLDLFWVPGNLELFVLSRPDSRADGHLEQLYTIPFAKSATTSQHSPDNTRYAFLQMDDRVLVYRGADQPDMSVINPESDVWQHIKIPNDYIATNWPLRYASLSSDGKLIAVAGRRGLTHYSAASGRWKLFADERQERDFTVRGGLLWFHHVLVAGVEVDKSHQIRLYSRDKDLDENNVLHSQVVPSPILAMSLLDNSLLVYTSDNTLYHFLILPTKDSIRLHLCGSISFLGIVQVPSRVRALSWLIPEAQKRFGDPAEDLIVATIIFLVDGKLVILRPRRAGSDEVRYDMQVLADRIEAYWTHLHGVGTLENSLWGFDGSGMRIWLDALTIEATRVDSAKDAYESVKESIYLRLDFYPLSILMDKGIIIGVDYETSSRSLPFALFKIQTGTHLFLPQFLRYHLSAHHLSSALTFAQNYSSIVYFAHSLEILLHSVLEDETESAPASEEANVAESGGVLPVAIEFLDHFPECLEVVVGCARKTEVNRWGRLFEVVGKPRDLFERCLEMGELRTAASYLLVLHNLEELDDAKDTIRLLTLAMTAKEYHLCKELLRFLRSIDETGDALHTAINEVGIINQPSTPAISNTPSTLIAPIAMLPSQTSSLDTRTPSPPKTLSKPSSPLSFTSHTSMSRQSPSPSPLSEGARHRVSSQFNLNSPRTHISPRSPTIVKPVPKVSVPEIPASGVIMEAGGTGEEGTVKLDPKL